MLYKKYAKVTNLKHALCAIYEPHPFRSSVISESIGSCINTGIADDEWIWVYYDYCCNPIALSMDKPDGVEIDKFTIDNLDVSWTTPEYAQKIVDYFNKEN